MKTLRNLRTTLRENWRTYILLSVATYGALVVMMTVTRSCRECEKRESKG